MASSETTRGAFIVLEGLDRSGKTTQVQKLEQRFQSEGKQVLAMRFPGTWCRRIRSTVCSLITSPSQGSPKLGHIRQAELGTGSSVLTDADRSHHDHWSND